MTHAEISVKARVWWIRTRAFLRGGPWLELAVIFLAVGMVLLIQQGSERERQGAERTRQIGVLTDQVQELTDNARALREEVTMLRKQDAVKDRTIAELTSALIAKGGDPGPILNRQRRDLAATPSPAPRPGTSPSATTAPKPSPTPQPTPSATTSPRPSPTPTPPLLCRLVLVPAPLPPLPLCPD
jgi:hypothetical protein